MTQKPRNTFDSAATAALARYRYAPVLRDGHAGDAARTYPHALHRPGREVVAASVNCKLQCLLVADDRLVGRWLQLRVEALRSDCSIELDTGAAFEHRLATTGMGHFNLLFAVLDFSAGATAASLAWLTRMQGMPDTPPLIVLAEDGDELSAVGAMRHGVADYLPRRLLTTKLLEAAIDHGLATHRAPACPSPLRPAGHHQCADAESPQGAARPDPALHAARHPG